MALSNPLALFGPLPSADCAKNDLSSALLINRRPEHPEQARKNGEPTRKRYEYDPSGRGKARRSADFERDRDDGAVATPKYQIPQSDYCCEGNIAHAVTFAA